MRQAGGRFMHPACCRAARCCTDRSAAVRWQCVIACGPAYGMGVWTHERMGVWTHERMDGSLAAAPMAQLKAGRRRSGPAHPAAARRARRRIRTATAWEAEGRAAVVHMALCVRLGLIHLECTCPVQGERATGRPGGSAGVLSANAVGSCTDASFVGGACAARPLHWRKAVRIARRLRWRCGWWLMRPDGTSATQRRKRRGRRGRCRRGSTPGRERRASTVEEAFIGPNSPEGAEGPPRPAHGARRPALTCFSRLRAPRPFPKAVFRLSGSNRPGGHPQNATDRLQLLLSGLGPRASRRPGRMACRPLQTGGKARTSAVSRRITASVHSWLGWPAAAPPE